MTGRRLAGQRRKRAQAGRTHKRRQEKKGPGARVPQSAGAMRGRVLREELIPSRGMIIGGEKKKK